MIVRTSHYLRSLVTFFRKFIYNDLPGTGIPFYRRSAVWHMSIVMCFISYYMSIRRRRPIKDATNQTGRRRQTKPNSLRCWDASRKLRVLSSNADHSFANTVPFFFQTVCGLRVGNDRLRCQVARSDWIGRCLFFVLCCSDTSWLKC